MKVIVGLLHHESNSFNPELTGLDEFIVLKGKEVIEKSRLYERASLKGIIDTLTKNNIEILPTIVALPTSEGGLVKREAYEYLKDAYIHELKKYKNYDGVCLDLHGSMTTEDLIDVEGDILSETRKIVGKDIPITVSLDMHAMVTDKMMKNANGLVSYRTAPHIDKYETGVRAATMLVKVLKEKIELTMEGYKIPFLVSGERSETDKYPMNELLKKIEEVDKEEKVIYSSYCLGFPWADVEFNTVSSIVVTQGDRKLADKKARYLAEEFWKKRYDFKFTTPAYSLEEALKLAMKEKEFPVFVIDSGDNPGAGSNQKIVEPLIYLKEHGYKEVLYGSVCDEEAVEKLIKEGVGKQKKVLLGQKNTDPNSGKVEFICKVKNINKYEDVTSVLVDINGIDVIISDKKVVMTEPEFVFSLGIKLEDYKIVMFKSGYLDPKYKPYAKKIMLALTPGYTFQELEKIPYKRVKRPIFPVDRMDEIEFEKYN